MNYNEIFDLILKILILIVMTSLIIFVIILMVKILRGR